MGSTVHLYKNPIFANLIEIIMILNEHDLNFRAYFDILLQKNNLSFVFGVRRTNFRASVLF